MRFGIKLDLGFPVLEEYRRLFGGQEALSCLRQLGIHSVETPLRPDTDPLALLDHVRACSRAGLLVTFHPYTERTPFNPLGFSHQEDNPCRRMHERFFTTCREAARLLNTPVVVNVHPAAGPSELERGDLIVQSVQFFQWASSWCRRNAPEVQPVAELQIRAGPGETIQRIGDEYVELLEILERSGVWGCWDFGHAFMNTRNFGLPLFPPAEFLRRIIHVHCHDADGEDHQPLVHGNVPWKEFLTKLAAGGFDGTVVLEVPARNFLASGGMESLERSAFALRPHLDGIR